MRIEQHYFKLRLLSLLLVIVLFACNGNKQQQRLKIIHAGSVSVPLKEIVDSFKAQNPDVIIETEAWGSKAGARRIIDLNQPCDVFISADYKVIDLMLIPEHASWNIPFATNQMALVYTNKSKYADEINSDNWIDILLKPDVIFSRSDPDSDPCGSRAVICIKLSEKFYKRPGLAAQMLTLHLNHIRPKETDLIALLEKNVIDYIFLYKSVAIQHKLKFVELPEEVNLSNSNLDSLYSTVQIEVAGSSPDKKNIEIGESMVYGITIPKSTQNQKLAEEFVSFFLQANNGQRIFVKHGQNSLVPEHSNTYKMIPLNLRKYVSEQ